MESDKQFWAAQFEYCRPQLARVTGKETKQMVLVESAEDVIEHSYLRKGSRLQKQTYASKVFPDKGDAVKWLLEQIAAKQDSLRKDIADLDSKADILRSLAQKD